MQQKRTDARFWIGLLISALFLVLALRNVEWTGVLNSWLAARWGLLLVGTATLIGGWWIAAFRWRVLLALPALRVRDTFAFITIGYLANTVLPLRLGDLARATLIGRKRELGISRALGSIASERVLDLLTLIAITLITALLVDIPPAIQAAMATMAAGGLGALLFLMFLAFNQHRLDWIANLLGRFMPHRIADKIMILIRNFATGAVALRSPIGLIKVFGLSFLIWGLAAITTLIWIRAFNLPTPWYAALLVLVMVNLGSAIPSSPGYVGVYHYLAVLALSLWVPDRNAALAYAIGTHAVNMLANVGLGAFFLTREGISLRDLRAQAGSQKSDDA